MLQEVEGTADRRLIAAVEERQRSSRGGEERRNG
jgi:hypothetical protein